MSQQPPPNPYIPGSFNAGTYVNPTGSLTRQDADLLYLHFNTAQGTENFIGITNQGTLSQQGDSNFSVIPTSTASYASVTPTDSSTKIPTTAWVQTAVGTGNYASLTASNNFTGAINTFKEVDATAIVCNTGTGTITSQIINNAGTTTSTILATQQLAVFDGGANTNINMLGAGGTIVANGDITSKTSQSVYNANGRIASFISGTGMTLSNATTNPSTATISMSGTAGTITATGSVTANSFIGTATLASNLALGTANNIPYQTAANTTGYITNGTAGQVLTYQASGAPKWATLPTTATTATNIAGGTANNIPYQSAANTTGFITNGTTGQVLTYQASGAPAWATLPTTATTATNIAGGSAGQIPYQSAANTTLFSSTGTTGQVLTSNGAGAPTWTTLSLTTATNLAGGSAGQIPYQSAANTTLFSSTGTAGQVLTSQGTGAPTWTNTASSIVTTYGTQGSVANYNYGYNIYTNTTVANPPISYFNEGYNVISGQGTTSWTFNWSMPYISNFPVGGYRWYITSRNISSSGGTPGAGVNLTFANTTNYNWSMSGTSTLTHYQGSNGAVCYGFIPTIINIQNQNTTNVSLNAVSITGQQPSTLQNWTIKMTTPISGISAYYLYLVLYPCC
jgi:hypothetical protein